MMDLTSEVNSEANSEGHEPAQDPSLRHGQGESTLDSPYHSSPSDPMDPKDRPQYVISVAAELVQAHPQTLRLYERKGLVLPYREGKSRLYSQRDIERIQYIQKLTRELGVNLAGVEEIARLQQELEKQKRKMQLEIFRLNHQIEDLEDQIGAGD